MYPQGLRLVHPRSRWMRELVGRDEFVSLAAAADYSGHTGVSGYDASTPQGRVPRFAKVRGTSLRRRCKIRGLQETRHQRRRGFNRGFISTRTWMQVLGSAVDTTKLASARSAHLFRHRRGHVGCAMHDFFWCMSLDAADCFFATRWM